MPDGRPFDRGAIGRRRAGQVARGSVRPVGYRLCRSLRADRHGSDLAPRGDGAQGTGHDRHDAAVLP